MYIEALVKSEFLIRLNDSKVKAEYVVKPPKNPKTIKFLVSSEIIFFSKMDTAHPIKKEPIKLTAIVPNGKFKKKILGVI